MTETTVNLVSQKMALGKYEEVQTESATALVLAREFGYLWAIGWHLGFLGQAALVQGRISEAQSLLGEAVQMYANAGLPLQHQQQAYLSLAARSLGQREQARAHLSQALTAILDDRDIFGQLSALPVAALHWADSGDMVKAVELDSLARRYPFISADRWWQDVAFNELDAAAEKLPAEVATQARARGRSRDLKEVAAELLAELRHAEEAARLRFVLP